MRRCGAVSVLSAAVLVLAAVPGFAEMEMGGDGGGVAIDLVVQRVIVQPLRAHVGDTVEVEAWIDNREDGSETSWAEVSANGKKVAQEMFRWGTPGADRLYKLRIPWDTTGTPPGTYGISVEVFVFHDASPFDNKVAVKQPVILVEPGGRFPGGEPAGGTATEVDPRYK